MESRVVRICAPVSERFTQDAIDGIVGDEFPLKIEETEVARARCLAAELADDGRSILLTLEADHWPEGLQAVFEPDRAYYSTNGKETS